MRVSERGQVTIPKKLRDRYGMHHDVEVEMAPAEDGILIRKRTSGEHPVDRIVGIFAVPGWSTDEYMAEIRGR